MVLCCPVGNGGVRPHVLASLRACEAPANACSLRTAPLRARGGQVPSSSEWAFFALFLAGMFERAPHRIVFNHATWSIEIVMNRSSCDAARAAGSIAHDTRSQQISRAPLGGAKVPPRAGGTRNSRLARVMPCCAMSREARLTCWAPVVSCAISLVNRSSFRRCSRSVLTSCGTIPRKLNRSCGGSFPAAHSALPSSGKCLLTGTSWIILPQPQGSWWKLTAAFIRLVARVTRAGTARFSGWAIACCGLMRNWCHGNCRWRLRQFEMPCSRDRASPDDFRRVCQSRHAGHILDSWQETGGHPFGNQESGQVEIKCGSRLLQTI